MATPLSPRWYEVRITTTAEEDLHNILEYIVDQDAPLNAARFIDRLRIAIAELAVMPNRWPRAREGLIAGIEWRQRVVGRYRIIFSVEGQTVFVKGIIHTARDPE